MPCDPDAFFACSWLHPNAAWTWRDWLALMAIVGTVVGLVVWITWVFDEEDACGE